MNPFSWRAVRSFSNCNDVLCLLRGRTDRYNGHTIHSSFWHPFESSSAFLAHPAQGSLIPHGTNFQHESCHFSQTAFILGWCEETPGMLMQQMTNLHLGQYGRQNWWHVFTTVYHASAHLKETSLRHGSGTVPQLFKVDVCLLFVSVWWNIWDLSIHDLKCVCTSSQTALGKHFHCDILSLRIYSSYRERLLSEEAWQWTSGQENFSSHFSRN